MKEEKQNTSSDKKIVVIAGLLAFVIMIASYVAALAQFSGDAFKIETESVSEIISDETSAEFIQEVFSSPIVEKKYEYYDDFVFENFPYRNVDVVNGSLAVIKDGANGFPSIDQSKIVNIGQHKTDNVYGLSNMSLVLYEDAIAGIDKFICGFFKEVPNNGLIINRGYTSHDKISAEETVIDLTTGYSVQLSIFNSAYKFSDVEFGFLRDQAYKYGVIQRYPEGKREYTMHDSDNTVYRYVGLAHSQYMNLYRLSLEEYIDKVRTEKVIEFKSELEENTAYVVYHVPLDENIQATYVPLPQGEQYSYSISGDGGCGFIVAVKVPL